MERTKKNIMIICYSFAMICAVTFSARFIKYIDILALRITLQVLLNILNGIIAALLFGLWHIINGNIIQVLFTFGIGLVFGFSKYKIKNCGYVGVSLAHGLYDFLNTIVRMFIVYSF